MERFDPISVIESAYRFDCPEREWMSGILQTVRPAWDQGRGVAMFDMRLDEQGMPDIGTTVCKGGLAEHFDEVIRAMNASIGQARVDLAYRKQFVYATLSERMKPMYPDFRDDPIYRKHAHPYGVYDFAAAQIADPTGTMLFLGAPLPEVAETSQQARKNWARIVAHVAAAYRLRQRALPTGIESEDVHAILDPAGRVLHLDDTFLERDSSRDSLEHAAEAIGRARSGMRRTAPEHAVRLWTALVDGQYSLVRHEDTDGKSYLLARKNDPEAAGPKGLDQRERQIASFAAMGHSDELIAYELGLDPELVATQLDNALTKLNLDSRAQLSQLWQMLQAGQSPAAMQ